MDYLPKDLINSYDKWERIIVHCLYDFRTQSYETTAFFLGNFSPFSDLLLASTFLHTLLETAKTIHLWSLTFYFFVMTSVVLTRTSLSYGKTFRRFYR